MNNIERMILINQQYMASILKILVRHALGAGKEESQVDGLDMIYNSISLILENETANED